MDRNLKHSAPNPPTPTEVVAAAMGVAAKEAIRSASDRIMDMIKQNGQYIGEPGRRTKIRELSGGIPEAERFRAELTKDAEFSRTLNDGGEVYRIPGENSHITYRPISRSGPPTISINIVDTLKDFKLKFMTDESNE